MGGKTVLTETGTCFLLFVEVWMQSWRNYPRRSVLCFSNFCSAIICFSSLLLLFIFDFSFPFGKNSLRAPTIYMPPAPSLLHSRCSFWNLWISLHHFLDFFFSSTPQGNILIPVLLFFHLISSLQRESTRQDVRWQCGPWRLGQCVWKCVLLLATYSSEEQNTNFTAKWGCFWLVPTTSKLFFGRRIWFRKRSGSGLELRTKE